MAGSVCWFVYACDNGTRYALLQDRSNGEGISNVRWSETESIFGIPRNVTPRRAYFGLGDRVLSVVVGSLAAYGALDPSFSIEDPIDGSTLPLIRKRPETIRLPRADDTGLDDQNDPT